MDFDQLTLEERRGLLKAEVLTKDEGARFQIANGFAIRHQLADQRGDYDRAVLDWLFGGYLGTVELTSGAPIRRCWTRSAPATAPPRWAPYPDHPGPATQ
jgi:hypothetical protein